MRHGVRKARGALGVVAILLPLFACCSRTAPIDYTGATATWDSWGGSPGGTRYSPATQITPDNVKHLKVAWTYRIGEPSLLPAHPTQAADVRRMLAQGLTPEVHRLPALEATDWTGPALEAAARAFAEANGLKLGQVAQPLRAALTGKASSPPLFEMLALLGREESLIRLRAYAP